MVEEISKSEWPVCGKYNEMKRELIADFAQINPVKCCNIGLILLIAAFIAVGVFVCVSAARDAAYLQQTSTLIYYSNENCENSSHGTPADYPLNTIGEKKIKMVTPQK